MAKDDMFSKALGIRRRTFLGVLGGSLVLPALGQETGRAFVAPAGEGSGASFDDAAPIGRLDELIQRVGPGGTIYLRSDLGAYAITDPVGIASGGRPGWPVRIIGVNAAMEPDQATLLGNRHGWRKPSNIAGALNASGFGGNTLFEMQSGANYLEFAHLAVGDLGRIFDYADVATTGLNVHDVSFHNVRDGLYTNEGSRLRNVMLHRFCGVGFSKKAVRFHGQCERWLIEDCVFDSGWQYGDRFAVGIECSDQARNLTIRGGATINCLDRHDGNEDSYWNGDGVSSERGNRDIHIIAHISAGNSDGGYDLKSETTTITRCRLERNKRNFRIWGGGSSNPIRIENCLSISPTKIGGSGGSHHIWAEGATKTSENAASILIKGGAMIGGEKDGVAIFADGEDVAIKLVGVDVSRLEPSMQKFKATDDSSKLIVGDVS